MAGKGRPKRVEKERAQLTCATCGAGNRLAPGVVDRGFQRCSHCDAALPVEGAGAYAIQNNSGGFTRVVAPGRSLFVLLLGRVVSLPAFLITFIMGDFAVAVMRNVARRAGAPPAVGWTILGLFIAVVLVLFALVWVEQRILVTQNRMELWWRLFGLDLRHRRFSAHRVRFEPKGGPWSGLRVKPLSGASLFIRTDGESEAKLLCGELTEAIEEARVPAAPGALPCPGCGAPVANPMAVIEAGGVECAHCGSGLVATKGGVVLGEATLVLARSPLDSPPRIDRRRGPSGVEWRLRPELLARPFTGLLMMLSGLGCGGGLAVLGAFMIVKSAPWHAFGILVALVLVPLGLGLLGYLFISALGRHRVWLDSTVLQHEIRLGPLRVRRRVVPLARLLSLRIGVGPASAMAKLKTALEESQFELPTLNGEGTIVAEELVEGLAERLRAMGRQVKLELSDEPPPIGQG